MLRCKVIGGLQMPVRTVFWNVVLESGTKLCTPMSVYVQHVHGANIWWCLTYGSRMTHIRVLAYGGVNP